MSRRRFVWLIILLGLVVGAVLAVPTSRYVLMGRIRGERFLRGRPTSYWIRGLHDPDRDVRRTAASSLNNSGSDEDPEPPPPLSGNEARAVVEALAEALGDPDADVRTCAAAALPSVGPESVSAVPALGRALQDAVPPVRAEAARSLGHLGPDASMAVPGLTRALQDTDGGVREAAAFALWCVTRKPDPCTEILADVLRDRRNPARVRQDAAEDLMAMGPAARRAIPILRASLTDPIENVRKAAADALRRVDRNAAAGRPGD